MSLTSELRDRTSPASRFVRAWFPNHQQVQRGYRAELAGRTLIPPGASVVRGTIGTAFDWHVRFLINPAPGLQFAVFGAMMLRRQPAHAPACQLLTTFATAGRDGKLPPPCGPPHGDRWLARACYALALLTEVYRAGLAPGSRLRQLGPDSSLDDLLALATDEEIDELLTLAAAARRHLLPHLSSATAVILGPTFAGSAAVGGADADLIADGLLVELKTRCGDRRDDGTWSLGLDRLDLDQLLGYVLLDYNDAYAIRSVGIYAARHGHLVCWQLAELLAELAGEPVDLPRVRAWFRQAVETGAVPSLASDLTGRLAPMDQLHRLLVHGQSKPPGVATCLLRVLPEEAATLAASTTCPVVLDWYPPAASEAKRLVVPVEVFDQVIPAEVVRRALQGHRDPAAP